MKKCIQTGIILDILVSIPAAVSSSAILPACARLPRHTNPTTKNLNILCMCVGTKAIIFRY